MFHKNSFPNTQRDSAGSKYCIRCGVAFVSRPYSSTIIGRSDPRTPRWSRKCTNTQYLFGSGICRMWQWTGLQWHFFTGAAETAAVEPNREFNNPGANQVCQIISVGLMNGQWRAAMCVYAIQFWDASCPFVSSCEIRETTILYQTILELHVVAIRQCTSPLFKCQQKWLLEYAYVGSGE